MMMITIINMTVWNYAMAWDWNEPDEITQNATNLCNGNPFSFNAYQKMEHGLTILFY